MIKTRNDGITLVALVITIILLLMLVGIVISQLTQNGILGKTKLAKEISDKEQELENTRLAEYEKTVEGYINGTNRDTNKSGYKVTLLWEGTAVAGNSITFLDNHTFDEFDKIRFRFVEDTVPHWGGEEEISIETILELINNNWNIGLYGYTSYHVSLCNFTENGFSVASNSVNKLYKIYGVNY